MDIIQLYESKKPYHPTVSHRIEEAYTHLKERRIGMSIISSAFVLIFAMTSKKRGWNEIGRRSLGMWVGGMAVHECYLWNSMLGKMYLVQREKVES